MSYARKLKPTNARPARTTALRLVGDERNIKEISQDWNQGDWENYLKTLEVGLRESLLSPHQWADLPTDPIDESGEIDRRQALVHRLFKTLRGRQKEIIQKIFFEGLKVSEAAEMMGISRQGAFALKKRALKRLRIQATKALDNFTYSKGRSEFCPLNTKKGGAK